jgi:hypothetical protein
MDINPQKYPIAKPDNAIVNYESIRLDSKAMDWVKIKGSTLGCSQ